MPKALTYNRAIMCLNLDLSCPQKLADRKDGAMTQLQSEKRGFNLGHSEQKQETEATSLVYRDYLLCTFHLLQADYCCTLCTGFKGAVSSDENHNSYIPKSTI